MNMIQIVKHFMINQTISKIFLMAKKKVSLENIFYKVNTAVSSDVLEENAKIRLFVNAIDKTSFSNKSDLMYHCFHVQ